MVAAYTSHDHNAVEFERLQKQEHDMNETKISQEKTTAPHTINNDCIYRQVQPGKQWWMIFV
jgi:hypothetical protein